MLSQVNSTESLKLQQRFYGLLVVSVSFMLLPFGVKPEEITCLVEDMHAKRVLLCSLLSTFVDAANEVIY